MNTPLSLKGGPEDSKLRQPEFALNVPTKMVNALPNPKKLADTEDLYRRIAPCAMNSRPPPNLKT